MRTAGRAEALAALTAVAEGGREGSILLVGEPGIGKSHVLAEVTAASEHGSLVRINAGESDYPLAGFSAVFAAIDDPRAIEFGGRFTLRSAHPSQMLAAAHDVLVMLRGLRLAPTTVLIDDVDRLDTESLLLVGLMANRLGGTGLRLIMTATRLPPTSPLLGTTVLRMLPLGCEDLAAIGAVLAPGADAAVVELLARRSGRNPLVLREHLRAAEPAALRGVEPLVLPPRPSRALGDLVQHLLGERSDEELRLLQDVALAPMTPLRALDHEDIDDSSRDAVLDLIAEGVLTSRGLSVSVRDPRLRAHLFWARSSRIVRERHRELALRVRPFDERSACWHDSFVDRDDRSGERLLRCAVELAAIGESDAAVEFAERALLLAPDRHALTAPLLELADALLHRGEIGAAARYARIAESLSGSHQDAIRLATISLRIGLSRSEHLQDGRIGVVADLHGRSESDGAGSLLAIAAIAHAERWNLDESRALLTQAAALAPPGQRTASLVAAVRSSVAALETGRYEPETGEVAERDPFRMLVHAHGLSWAERFGEARAVLSSLVVSPKLDEPVWSDLAGYHLARNEICAGDHRAARAAITDWGTSSPWVPASSSRNLLLQGWFAASLDRSDAAEPLLREAAGRAGAEGRPAIVIAAAAQLAESALLRGDPETCLREHERIERQPRQYRDVGYLTSLGDHVEACVMVGRGTEAAAAAARLRTRLRSHPSRRGSMVLLRLQALLQPGAAAIAPFEAARDAFTPLDSPFELGRTLLAFADRLGELGQTEAAREQRFAAQSAFDAAGAAGWSARSGGTGVQMSEVLATSLLSDDEREIVRRVLLGQRNQDIADALFVSLRTVELRLTRIYRSLGIESRSQLAALVSRSAR
ncbi:MAG: LuxR family transcriptional regulator [Microbacteriaceae bacterium]